MSYALKRKRRPLEWRRIESFFSAPYVFSARLLVLELKTMPLQWPGPWHSSARKTRERYERPSCRTFISDCASGTGRDAVTVVPSGTEDISR
jgi:hypothetical protein